MEFLIMIICVTYGILLILSFILGVDSMNYAGRYKYKLGHILFPSYFLGQLAYLILNLTNNLLNIKLN